MGFDGRLEGLEPGFEESLGLEASQVVKQLVAGLSVNTRGGGDFGSGNLTCNVARAVSRRDVLAAVCFMAPAAVVQFASAKSLPPKESLPPNRFRWNMVPESLPPKES